MLFATQNPISMAGRQETSRAIRRRLLFQEFKSLPRDEMEFILKQKFDLVPESEIKAHVDAHLRAVNYAKEHHLEPAPVFRDLHNIVEKEQLNKARILKIQRKSIDTTLASSDKENVAKTPLPIVKRKIALSRSYDSIKSMNTSSNSHGIKVGVDTPRPKQKH
jgi:MoxR-like ATPase